MKGKIPQTFIQDVVARTDIVPLVQARVSLKKRGDNYVACCPFHNEKSPSFTVSQSKQFYYCFGCGANGNAIGFLMEYDRLPFVEAVQTLAEQHGLTIPTEFTQEKSEDLTPLYTLLDKASKHFQQKLKQSPHAIAYLKSRGLTGEIAKDFAVGYAPDAWSFLCDALSKEKEGQQALLTTGMIIEKNKTRHYDRFRDRIMFPIRDIRGRTIAFGGRVLKDGTPKYLNSPETPVFHKSKTLYGLYEAYQQQRQLSQALVVEGYMDVVSLAQHGIHYAVATLGTALNAQHVQLLSRYTSNIIFCFDGDTAGKKAAWKALTISLPMLRDGFDIRFLFLPMGEDPDTLIQKIGHNSFEEQVKNATPLPDVFFAALKKQHATDTIAGKAALAKEATGYLKSMPEGIFKNLLLDQLATMLGVQRDELDTLTLHKNEQAKPIAKSEKLADQLIKLPELKARLTPTQLAIQLLLQHPNLATHIENTAFLQKSQSSEQHLLNDLIQHAKQNPSVTMGSLLTQYSDDAQRYLVNISAQPSHIPEPGRKHEFIGALQRIQEHHQAQQLSQLIEKAKHTELNHEEKQLLQLLLANKQASTSDLTQSRSM